jgi:MurNAc alpha-1-phosphate uridylyltransferase
MLLAAGRGERMRPLTDHTPKPLLMAGGKPLIVWHIENLARAGIRDLVINHAHLGGQIEAALGDGRQLGVSIRYSPENPALETAGGIANALPLLGGEPFAVINSDIYCDYDFAQLPIHVSVLRQRRDIAHLVLVDNPAHHPNGDFGLQSVRVVDGMPKFTFSGIGIYQPALFAHIPRGSSAPLAPLLRAQIAQGKVSGEHYAGRWVDVGTPQRLEELDNELRKSHNAAHV